MRRAPIRATIILMVFASVSSAGAKQGLAPFGSVPRFRIAATDINLSRPAQPFTYFDKVGRKFAILGFEIAVMRVFSVASWSNFGSMVISIALLGYGLAGTLLTFLEKRAERNADRWLATTASLVGPAMAVVYVVAQQLPFNPVMITTDIGICPRIR